MGKQMTPRKIKRVSLAEINLEAVRIKPFMSLLLGRKYFGFRPIL